MGDGHRARRAHQGANKYATAREEEGAVAEYDETWQETQIANLKEVRRPHAGRQVGGRAPQGSWMWPVAAATMLVSEEACLAYCTVGEMSDVFLEVFGPYKEPNVV